MTKEYPQGGPLPTIIKLAEKIRELAGTYPLARDQAEKQAEAASQINDLAGQIQKEAAKLLEIASR